MSTQSFTTQELQLLTAVHDEPRNDTPRLAYATWFDNSGQSEMAEFIRLQCQQPYFALQMSGSPGPRVTVDDYWAKYDDEVRANRTIELLRRLHGTFRFPDLRLWQEYSRGLPLYEAEGDDGDLPCGVDQFSGVQSPLARYRLLIRTSRLADWLAHPIMRFVDVLRITPDDPEDFASAEFVADDILRLEAFPRLNHFRELGLSGPATEDVKRLAKERLEPRVVVDYCY